MSIQYVNLINDNLLHEHICCAIGKGKHEKGEVIKRNWLKTQLGNGLIFRKLDERGKVFIELMPSELAFKPIIAPNFMVIHCLWVSGKFKGHEHGKKLLKYAIEESKKLGKDGICVLAGKANYMTDAKFYKHFGFEKVDQSDNEVFELMSLNFNQHTAKPYIAAAAKASVFRGGKDITVFTTQQCPFVPTCLGNLKIVAAEYNLEVTVVKLSSHEEVCNSPSAFGTFGVFLNEKFVTHEMLSSNGYRKKLTHILS